MVKTSPRRTLREAPGISATTPPGFDGRGVVVFYVLTFVLSWAWTIPIALSGSTIEKGNGWPTHFPALAGPLLAALAVTAWRARAVGVRDLARRMVAWRAPWSAWLVTVSPAIFLGIALVGVLIAGGDPPAATDFGLFSGLPAVGVVGVLVLVTLVNGYGEETGWRGYALPQLQRRFGPSVATLVVAGLWALWHTPYFFALASYQDLVAFELVGFVLGIAAGAFILTWLYNRSGGSILLPVVWHGVYNVVGATAAATGTLAAVVTTLVMVHGGTLAWLEIRAQRKGGASVIGPV